MQDDLAAVKADHTLAPVLPLFITVGVLAFF